MWIPAYQELLRHRKTIDAADLLDMQEVHIVGHLLALWWWAADHCPEDGELGVSRRVIERAAEWQGERGKLAAALIAVGFIDDRDGSLWLHDWTEYGGKFQKKRRIDRERKARGKGSDVDDDGFSGSAPPDRRRHSSGVPAEIQRKASGTLGQEEEEEDEDGEPTDVGSTPLPPKGEPAGTEPNRPFQPFDLFVAVCEEAGHDPTQATKREKGIQLKKAQQIIADGFDEADVRACARFLRSQDWRTDPVTTLTLAKEIGKWKLAGKPTAARVSVVALNGAAGERPPRPGMTLVAGRWVELERLSAGDINHVMRFQGDDEEFGAALRRLTGLPAPPDGAPPGTPPHPFDDLDATVIEANFTTRSSA